MPLGCSLIILHVLGVSKDRFEMRSYVIKLFFFNNRYTKKTKKPRGVLTNFKQLKKDFMENNMNHLNDDPTGTGFRFVIILVSVVIVTLVAVKVLLFPDIK